MTKSSKSKSKTEPENITPNCHPSVIPKIKKSKSRKKQRRGKSKSKTKHESEKSKSKTKHESEKSKSKTKHVNEKSNPKTKQMEKLLRKLRHSREQVYTFEEDMSQQDICAFRSLCSKFGMKVTIRGTGENRFVVSVTKTNEVTMKPLRPPYITFSEGSRGVLQELFTNYPPDEVEAVQEVVPTRVADSGKRKVVNDNIFCKPIMNKAEIETKLQSYYDKLKNSPKLSQITEKRCKLPIASFKDVITTTVESHQVVLISGATGCGKTTQVPQIILDYMWSKSQACKVVCTQPRRISATSVAERISSERGQEIGNDVGYKIRLESKGGRHSSIVFCTNGILLRVLVSKGAARMKTEGSHKNAQDDISDMTHIIVDEIHERDNNCDFMITILRDILSSYPHLRLILMSATLDAERFSQYFGGCPIIRIPGFTYPVKSLYLEDALTIINSTENNHIDPTLGVLTVSPHLTQEFRAALDEAISLAWSTDQYDSLLGFISSEGTQKVPNYQHSLTGLTPLMVLAGKGRVGDVRLLLSLGADCSLRANDGTTALQLAEREKQGETAEILKRHTENALTNTVEEQNLLNKYLETASEQRIDIVLIEQLLRKLCTVSKEGGILVFLPGWYEINATRENLLANPYFEDSSKFIILALHSMIPSKDQKKVFDRPASGCRKIVLSTNISEASVTIDDIVYVIDSGRAKVKSYDPYNNVSTLFSEWISKASAKQREGRAGRCQPGICYHLYPKVRASSLPDFQVPEIQRMRLEGLCLQVKLIDSNLKIEDFMQKLLDPPNSDTVKNALTVLESIGALTPDEDLTQLGQKMGSLPVHPIICKMLFFAILMNCLEPALTIACASDYRDPFIMSAMPNGKMATANYAKKELASTYGGFSDHLAIVTAFEGWKNASEKGQRNFSCKYHLSQNVMKMLSGMREQLRGELTRHGFISRHESSYNLNAQDPGIIHAVLVAGLYPMIGKLLPVKKGSSSLVVETVGGLKVRLHRSSINVKLSFSQTDERPLVLFDEITTMDSGNVIRDCSIIGPLPVLLLAREITVVPAVEDDDTSKSVENVNGVNVKKDETEDKGLDKECMLSAKVDDVEKYSTEEEGIEKESKVCKNLNKDEMEEEGKEDKNKQCEKLEDSTKNEMMEGVEKQNSMHETLEDELLSSSNKRVTVVIDRWLSCETTALDIAQIYYLRERLSAAILSKVTNPYNALPPSLNSSMYAMGRVLSFDGISGISVRYSSASKVNRSGTEVNHSGTEVNHSGTEVNHSGTEVNHSGTKVNHSGTKVNHSGTKISVKLLKKPNLNPQRSKTKSKKIPNPLKCPESSPPNQALVLSDHVGSPMTRNSKKRKRVANLNNPVLEKRKIKTRSMGISGQTEAKTTSPQSSQNPKVRSIKPAKSRAKAEAKAKAKAEAKAKAKAEAKAKAKAKAEAKAKCIVPVRACALGPYGLRGVSFKQPSA